MQKTVKELLQMYRDGKIHDDQSTQRSFLYGSTITDEYDGELTKAGSVIKSILERKIQLPALYFWSVQDDEAGIHFAEDEFNIHDGKQRLLSVINFIRGDVITRINSRERSMNELTDAQREELLNYTFDIVVRKGTLREEEQSFELINTSGMPLTAYEALKGAYHGKYMTEFEAFIDNKALSTDFLLKVGESRGKQAIWALYASLGILTVDGNDKKLQDKAKLLKIAGERLNLVRTNDFDVKANKMDEILDFYVKLGRKITKGGGNEKNPQKLWAIASYVIKHSLDKASILGYYEKWVQTDNDIDRWTYDTHLCAIRNLINGTENDPRRFFDPETKNILFKRSSKCCACGEDKKFNELEVDHITPWSKGGKTVLANARLLCKPCNCSKGSN